MLLSALHGEPVDAASLGGIVTEITSEFTNAPTELATLATHFSQEEGLAEHCLNTSLLAMAMGIASEFDSDELRDIGLAGLLHDWGMAKVSAPIADGSKELTESEWLQVQQHSKYTLELISRIEGLPKRVALAAYQVHERCDGSGYPRSAPGSRTHQFAKMLSVADVYCALTTARPYRPPLSPYAGMEFMIRKANLGKFDPDLVRLLLGIVTLFPVGTFVSLSDGAIAVVAKGNPKC